MPKLLLADDSMTVHRVMELTFSGENVEVITASNGEEAMARIAAERPDIVLADIGMPNGNGYDVAAFIKRHAGLSHIPVLLLAGAFEPVDEERAQQVNCDGVLVKPFEPQQLIARVRELMERTARHPLKLVDTSRVEAGRGPDVAEPPPVATSEVDPGAAGGPATPSLEEYFARLDAAFASRDRGGATGRAPEPSSSREPAPERPSVGQTPVPTLEDLLAASQVSLDSEARSADSLTRSLDNRPRSELTHAFYALLEAEGAAPPSSGSVTDTSGQPEPAATDALVEEVTRRVLERLSAEGIRKAVADLIADVARRVVHEEVSKVRRGQV